MVDRHVIMCSLLSLSLHVFFVFAESFQLPKIQIAALVLIINEHLSSCVLTSIRRDYEAASTLAFAKCHGDCTWWRNAGLSVVCFITRLFSFAECRLISLEITIASLLNPR